jgi:hypothetical protein
MAASLTKNELVASKRRVDLIVMNDGGLTLANRGTDFIALGIVFVCGVTSPHYAVAAGTVTNKRRPLVVADDVFTATHGTETFTAVAHGLETGDGPFRVVNSGGALPTGISAGTDYWIIYVDADNFMLATSLADAYAGTEVTISDNGTGTHTIQDTASTARGLDGYFTYEATQAETDFDGSEFSVIIEGTNYERANSGGTYTSVNISSGVTDLWGYAIEGAHTAEDVMRLLAGVLAGKATGFNTGTIAFKSLDGSKTRVTVTTDSTGRLTSTIGDLT